MELTKNTSVDPAKMIGKNYIEAVNAKFPNTILDEEWSTPNQVTLTIKTNMLPDVVEYRRQRQMCIRDSNIKVGYLWCSGMMSVQFMATMQCTTCFPWRGK